MNHEFRSRLIIIFEETSTDWECIVYHQMTFGSFWVAVRFKPWNGDLNNGFILMAELTYRGLKYTQTKSAKGLQEVHLQYCGHEIMSKRIHDAMKAEMGWKPLKKFIFSS